jgi:hypothetical protein
MSANSQNPRIARDINLVEILLDAGCVTIELLIGKISRAHQFFAGKPTKACTNRQRTSTHISSNLLPNA